MGRRWLQYLRTGILPPGKPSRSEADAAVALGMINCGWPFECFHAEMSDPANKGSAKFFDICARKTPKAAEAYLVRTWNSEVEWNKLHPACTDRDDLRTLIQLELNALRPGPGRTAATDQAVIAAHLKIAFEACSLAYTASIRQIAEASGFRPETVMRANRRLIKAGRLKLLNPNTPEISRWRLRLAVGTDRNSSPHTLACEGYCYDLRRGPNHDIWHHRALGKGCWVMWILLEIERGLAVPALANKLLVPRGTITARLRKLKRYGLARLDGKFWYRVERDLNELSELLGIAGAGLQRKQRHQAERELYQQRQQEQESAREELDLRQRQEGQNPHANLISSGAPGNAKPIVSHPKLLESALLFARHGLKILPVHGLQDSRCTCGNGSCLRAGAHLILALALNGVKDATINENTIREWWRRYPTANMGIATGPLAKGRELDWTGFNFWAVEVDPRQGGDQAWGALMEANGGRLDTGRVHIPGDATEWLFMDTGEFDAREDLGPGVHFKGDGNFIVAPPSQHVSGQPYAWEHPVEAPAEMPGWLRAIAARPNAGTHA